MDSRKCGKRKDVRHGDSKERYRVPSTIGKRQPALVIRQASISSNHCRTSSTFNFQLF
jgi:hypothetical protein